MGLRRNCRGSFDLLGNNTHTQKPAAPRSRFGLISEGRRFKSRLLARATTLQPDAHRVGDGLADGASNRRSRLTVMRRQ